jgi:glutamyl-tRNA synthetase
MEELIQLFSLDRVSKSGAKFDYEKGKWFNHQYVQLKPIAEITDLFQHILVDKDIIEDSEKVMRIVSLVRERAHFVNELWDQASFFFVAPESYCETALKKRWKADTSNQMLQLAELLETLEDFSAHAVEASVKAWMEEKGYGMGAVMNAFRLCVVGESKGPHMFDIAEIIGKEETISRLMKAVETIRL